MTRRKGVKILILDDEPDMAENVRRIVEAAGYDALVETDGLRALAAVEQERPELVLTDLRMPDIDGLAFLERVKSRHPEIAVIVFTGYASAGCEAEAIKKGASDYFAKPFRPDELVLRVEKALARKAAT
jgi:DNA-binding NtrC family response regulator